MEVSFILLHFFFTAHFFSILLFLLLQKVAKQVSKQKAINRLRLSHATKTTFERFNVIGLGGGGSLLNKFLK